MSQPGLQMQRRGRLGPFSCFRHMLRAEPPVVRVYVVQIWRWETNIQIMDILKLGSAR